MASNKTQQLPLPFAEQVGEVGTAVFGLRRAHSDQRGFRPASRAGSTARAQGTGVGYHDQDQHGGHHTMSRERDDERERRDEIVRGLRPFVHDGEVYELRILKCVDNPQRPRLPTPRSGTSTRIT